MSYVFAPFPVDVFPESLARYIRNVAEAMVCPPDLVGTLLLGVLSAAIGSSRVVRVKEGWTEPAVLYAAIVAPPSSKKSPVFKEVLKPVKERQRQQYEAYQEQRLAYEQELEDWEAADTKLRGPKPQKPVLQRSFLVDATFEALAKLLEQNPQGLLLGLDELAAWIGSMNQYRKGKGADREHWLSLWSCSMITVDRASKDEPIILLHPFVSVMGGIQPDRLDMLRGKDHDGFIDRILFSFPEERPSAWTDETIATLLRKQYTDLYNQLYDLRGDATESGSERPLELSFSVKAREAFIDVLTLNNEEINREGNPFLQSVFSKLEAYFFRFALILQLAESPNSHQIEEGAVKGAMLLLRYFKDQVRKVYAHIAKEEIQSQHLRALEVLRTHGGPMKMRDFYNRRAAGVSSSKAARKLYEELESAGYGKMVVQQNSSGGRPTITFHLKYCDCTLCNQQSVLRKVN